MWTEARPRISPNRRGDEGFALGLVVLLLFTISTLGAVGYKIVRTEAIQAQYSLESTQALTVAQGGLRWFTGQQRGLVPDTATFSINGGTALVTSRKIATLSADEDLYLVTSRGSFIDPRRAHVPAVRTVSQYAVLKNMPMKPLAPLVTTAGRIRVRQSAIVDGNDHAAPGQCTAAPVPSWAGAVARSSVQTHSGGTVLGVPPGLTYGSFSKVVEAVGLPWDVLSDSSFPVEYDGTWPDFSTLPSTDYPVVRVDGDFAPYAAQNGRGVLIVTGQLRIPSNSNWHWQGIVVAGDLENVGPDGLFLLEGLLAAGQGASMGHWDMDAGAILFNSCYVAWAGAALAHLRAVGGGWWETI